MSEVQAPVTTEREVTIYATRGGQMQKIITSATNWGELQPLVRNAGFDLSSLLAAENINKTDLVNDLAVLPEGNFRLFLRPKQTKSGALDRKACFAAIKDYLANNPQDKAKFSINGRNVTQLPTATVQDLVAKYIGNVASESVTTTSKTVKEVKYALEPATPADLTDIERVEEALSIVSTLKEYPSYYKVLKHLGKLRFEISPDSAMAEETEEEAIAREAREMFAGYR